MIRLARVEDAPQLLRLNEAFNGDGETTLELVKASLGSNRQETVVVAEEGGALVGFVCVQLKRSFCYSDVTAEITEVYVDEQYRRRGIASEMIAFAESHCQAHYPLHKFELLTGAKNRSAQALYMALEFRETGEMHMTKRRAEKR